MSALLERINEATKAAMRARDRERLGLLRQLTAAVKQKQVDGRGAGGENAALADDDVLALIEKQIKQRRESATAFDGAGRDDLAATERYEIGVLEEFMPAAADAGEVEAAIDAAIATVQPAGMKDMGKVMAQVKQALAGRVEMGAVSAQVKAKLAP